jgi:DNA-binding winged helix-turn-helix (wHTH) protein
VEEHAGAEIVLFGGFRFDRRRALLSRQDEDGSLTPVAIGSRALDILGLLIDRHGDIVTKDDILNAVWPGTVVEGANVAVEISTLRRALNDGESDGNIIQTIPGRGYRLAAAITRCEAGLLPAVGGDGADENDESGLVSPATTSPRAPQGLWRGVAAVLVVLTLGAATGWIWNHRWSGALPPLSMVVLPFTNLSNDADQEYSSMR